jgi:hypothetical protein
MSVRDLKLQYQPGIRPGNDTLHPRRAQRPLIPMLPYFGIVGRTGGARYQQCKQVACGPASARLFSRRD